MILGSAPVRWYPAACVNDPFMADFKQWGLRAAALKSNTIDELIKALHVLLIP
jgi:hypothetical protein